MFTGIIQAVGQVSAVKFSQGDATLTVQFGELPIADIQLGDSIAVNGTCLTVVTFTAKDFQADVSVETMNCTTFADLKTGSKVNLEMALTPTTRLGGHLVSGHVDGVGEVAARNKDARSEKFEIKAPKELMKYIAEKGSICIDGISLTVNKVSAQSFEVNIVPHTLVKTIMASYQVGSKVNLEVDLIARYLERLVLGGMAAEAKSDSLSGISAKLLEENGYIK